MHDLELGGPNDEQETSASEIAGVSGCVKNGMGRQLSWRSAIGAEMAHQGCGSGKRISRQGRPAPKSR